MCNIKEVEEFFTKLAWSRFTRGVENASDKELLQAKINLMLEPQTKLTEKAREIINAECDKRNIRR